MHYPVERSFELRALRRDRVTLVPPPPSPLIPRLPGIPGFRWIQDSYGGESPAGVILRESDTASPPRYYVFYRPTTGVDLN